MKKFLLYLVIICINTGITTGQSITITSPNGGESWTGCTTQNITWSASGTSNYYSIDYSTDGGSSWTSVTSYYNTTGGTYSWTVPNVSSSNCKIKIIDSNNSGINDQSDNIFTINAALIVTAPNGGASWEAGTTKTITWAAAPTSNYFKVDYSTDNGNNWTSITTYTTSLSYNWSVPNYPSENCFVKVTD